MVHGAYGIGHPGDYCAGGQFPAFYRRADSFAHVTGSESRCISSDKGISPLHAIAFSPQVIDVSPG